MEPIHSFFYLIVTNQIMSHKLYIIYRGVIIGHFGNTLSQSKAASVIELLAIQYFHVLQRRQLEESLGQFHMASLFEERALRDLVRGLKTLRGGLVVALRLAAHHRSGSMLCCCRLLGAGGGGNGLFLIGS